MDKPEEPKQQQHPKCQQVSVIQRTPSSLPAAKPESQMVIQEPEQEAPIDYHVPKKDTEKDFGDINKNKLALAIKRGQILIAGRRISGGNQILMAAAGHSRSGGGGGHTGGQQSGGSSGGSRNSSGGNSYTVSGGGGMSSGGSGGAVGGSGGGGGPGKSNYGPSSPPTGSLPPFYESLKGGGLHGYQQYSSSYQSLMNGGVGSNELAMDCDTGQELPNHYPPNGGDGPPKQYSLLQNVCATYGICVKEEDDLSSYVKDQNFLQYDDALMVDSVTGAVVDPLQFTATLTFSSPADHTALLESLSDAADLFLREVSLSLI